MKRWNYTGYMALLLFFCVTIAGCSQEKEISKKEENKRVEQSEDTEKLSGDYEKYSNANSSMIYTLMENESGYTLVQRDLKGNKIQEISHKQLEKVDDLLWVNDNEILWSCEKKSKTAICTTPIIQTQEGQKVDLDHMTEVFDVPGEYSVTGGEVYPYGGGHSGGYVDDTKILIHADDEEIYYYNRKEGKKPVSILPKNESANLSQYCLSWRDMICGDSFVYHTRRKEGVVEEAAYGFYIYSLTDRKSKLIDNRCFTDAAFIADEKRGKIYYQVISDQSIWQYDVKTEKKAELVSEKQLKQCYEENGLCWEDAYYNDSFYLDGDTLYWIKNRKEPLIFTYDFAREELKFEERLTEEVRKSGAFEQDSVAQMFCVAEGNVLLAWYNVNYDDFYTCVDVKTKESQPLQEDSVQMGYYDMVSGIVPEKMRVMDSDDIRWGKEPYQGTTPKPLSKSEQLDIMVANRDMWSDYNEEGYAGGPVYAITDLDANGRLEVICSCWPQGSGGYTYTQVYQISSDGKRLKRCSDDTFQGFDIVGNITTAYRDVDGLYYYVVSDYYSGGVGARGASFDAVVLKNGYFTNRNFAYGMSELNKKKNGEIWEYYRLYNGKEITISEKEFDKEKLAEQFFKGMEKKSVNITWIDWKKKISDKKLRKCLAKSCEEFSVK